MMYICNERVITKYFAWAKIICSKHIITITRASPFADGKGSVFKATVYSMLQIR